MRVEPMIGVILETGPPHSGRDNPAGERVKGQANQHCAHHKPKYMNGRKRGARCYASS